jgi:hypothetical protein
MKSAAGILTLVIVAGLAGTLVGRSTAPVSDLRAAARAEADAGLDRIVPELNLDDTPLDQAIESLREQTDTNIAVHWQAIEAAGVRRRQLVTLRLRRLPLRQTLDILCQVAAGDNAELCVEARQGVIHLSTAEELDRHAFVRLYEVKDLLKWDDTQVQNNPATNGATLFAGSNGPTPTSYHEAVDQLVQIITETVAPDSWRDAGGTVGSIRDFNGHLLVSQTRRNHLSIEKLLAQLRAGPPKPTTAPTF